MTKFRFMAVSIVFILMAILGHSLSWATYNITTDGEIYANPNSLIQVPLSIENSSGLECFDIVATFDPNILEFQEDKEMLSENFSSYTLVTGHPEPNEVRISGIADEPPPSSGKFITIFFKVKSGVEDPDDTTIKLSGIPDEDDPVLNPFKNLNLTVNIIFQEESFVVPVKVTGVTNFASVLVTLLDGNGHIVQKMGVNWEGLTEFNVEAGTYQIQVQSPGCKAVLTEEFEVNGSQDERTITLEKLGVGIDLRGSVTEGPLLKLDFGIIEDRDYIAWPSDKLLQLKFFKSGDTNTPSGNTITFTPGTPPSLDASGPVESYGLIDPNDPDACFDVKYISLELDPNIYDKGPGSEGAYTVSFRTIVTDNIYDPNATHVEFNRSFSVKKNQTESEYIFQYQSSPIAAGSMSGMNFSLKGEITLSSGVIKSVKINLTLADNFYLFLTDPNGNQLAIDKLLELKVEGKPSEKDSKITVVSIDFIDPVTGKRCEYNPGMSNEAEPISFNLPLHDDLQPGGLLNADDTLTKEDIEKYLGTKYAIFFESSYTGGVPTRFVPKAGESFSAYQDPVSGLWYAFIVVKHSSEWYVDALPTKEEKEEGDHWYECFIKTIRPGFLSK